MIVILLVIAIIIGMIIYCTDVSTIQRLSYMRRMREIDQAYVNAIMIIREVIDYDDETRDYIQERLIAQRVNHQRDAA